MNYRYTHNSFAILLNSVATSELAESYSRYSRPVKQMNHDIISAAGLANDGMLFCFQKSKSNMINAVEMNSDPDSQPLCFMTDQ